MNFEGVPDQVDALVDSYDAIFHSIMSMIVDVVVSHPDMAL